MNQQIYDVLPGRPYGSGKHGSVTLSSDPHTRRRGSTTGTKTFTINSAGFSNNDLVLIHQTSNHSSPTSDNWEVNQISSGGGTTTLTMLNNLGKTYTNAQILDIKEYINLTIGSFTVSGWNVSNDYGGLLAIAALGVVTWSGTVTCIGGNGSSTTSDTGGRPSAGVGGFRGGWNSTDGSTSQQGEGHSGDGVENTSANQNGGGGASADSSGGGGGGNASSGGSGGSGGGGGSGGTGGSSAGNASLTALQLGGGGGGGKRSSGEAAGGGGSGGGAMIGWFRNVTVTGGANFRGGNGGSGNANAGGGGGAGGSILINGQLVALGSSKLIATAGSGSGYGGAGSTGRIRVNFGAKHSGTTSPTYSYAQNVNLNVVEGGSTIAMM